MGGPHLTLLHKKEKKKFSSHSEFQRDRKGRETIPKKTRLWKMPNRKSEEKVKRMTKKIYDPSRGKGSERKKLAGNGQQVGKGGTQGKKSLE